MTQQTLEQIIITDTDKVSVIFKVIQIAKRFRIDNAV
jgi:hypothetical protein